MGPVRFRACGGSQSAKGVLCLDLLRVHTESVRWTDASPLRALRQGLTVFLRPLAPALTGSRTRSGSPAISAGSSSHRYWFQVYTAVLGLRAPSVSPAAAEIAAAAILISIFSPRAPDALVQRRLRGGSSAKEMVVSDARSLPGKIPVGNN
ncbi:hypothetical protein NDU88_001318 [Pleurodeles waltl]|uniref:Uncharacterized protein n=1 Tax=Pleurodeles waltl TaxID=8319 RepID=A0AAV7TJC2_PLEWA|nr:hypothetical protein NDU88_001318 [Pleurodeles waltl]